jgi:hypothetical protein
LLKETFKHLIFRQSLQAMDLAVEAEPDLPGHILMDQGDGAAAAEALQPDVPEEDQQHQLPEGADFPPDLEFLHPAVLGPPQPPLPPHGQLLLRHASQSSLDESSQKFGSKVNNNITPLYLLTFIFTLPCPRQQSQRGHPLGMCPTL